MTAKGIAALDTTSARWYRGANVPMRAIRKFARQVAERFQPDKIILFGSRAYGTPHGDSDVDILVVMPCRHQHSQAVRIRWAVPVCFPMDLLVRTPANLKWRLAEGESFHTEIVNKGKVLYEKSHARVDAGLVRPLPEAFHETSLCRVRIQSGDLPRVPPRATQHTPGQAVGPARDRRRLARLRRRALSRHQ